MHERIRERKNTTNRHLSQVDHEFVRAIILLFQLLIPACNILSILRALSPMHFAKTLRLATRSRVLQTSVHKFYLLTSSVHSSAHTYIRSHFGR